MKKKRKCNGCRKIRKLRKYKNLLLCWSCYSKRIHILPCGKKFETLEEALAKTYEIKGYLDKNSYIHAFLNPPQILIGHKIKLVLADGV